MQIRKIVFAAFVAMCATPVLAQSTTTCVVIVGGRICKAGPPQSNGAEILANMPSIRNADWADLVRLVDKAPTSIIVPGTPGSNSWMEWPAVAVRTKLDGSPLTVPYDILGPQWGVVVENGLGTGQQQQQQQVVAGRDGRDGRDGARGPRGYTGAQGQTGLTGPTGPQGNDGRDGIQGPQGANGPRGEQGVHGQDGIQGLQGVQGTPGVNGVNGTNGATGATGPQGPRGPRGRPAPTPKPKP